MSKRHVFAGAYRVNWSDKRFTILNVFDNDIYIYRSFQVIKLL